MTIFNDIESIFSEPTSFLKFQLHEINLLNLIIEEIEKEGDYVSLNKKRLKLLKTSELSVQSSIDYLGQTILNQLQIDAILTLDRLIYKPGLSTQFTPWHQDGAYWGKQEMLRVWVALDNFNEHSGCLKIYQGQYSGILNHSDTNIPDFFNKEIKSICQNNFKSIEAEKGDIVLFNETSIHGSFPNQSDQAVRAITGYLKLNSFPLKRQV